MSNEDEIQPISPEVACRITIFALLASSPYHKDDRVRFEVERLGWVQVDLDGNPTNKPTKKHPLSGLAYDIYEKQQLNEVVFAFQGADSKVDYLAANLALPPFNFQYRRALREFGRYLNQNSPKRAY